MYKCRCSQYTELEAMQAEYFCQACGTEIKQGIDKKDFILIEIYS